jgi:hypothetical protein
MSEILDKISSYNIFNYLLPGSLFAVIADGYSSYSLIQDDVLIGIFAYYFIGLVISRIGSLVIEPLLIKIGFLKYSDYPDFVSASKADKKIDLLVEVNNMYRTLLSLFAVLIAFLLFDRLATELPTMRMLAPYAGFIGLIGLFLFSYRKQTDYIVKRVDASKNSNS